MKKKLLIIMVLLLLAPLLLVQIPNVKASNLTDNFNYNPMYWEDWTESTSNCGGARWETNHTVLIGTNDSTVYGTSSYTKISRYFEIPDDEDKFELEAEFHIFNTTVTWNGLWGFYIYYKDGDAFNVRWLGNSLRCYWRNRAGTTSYQYLNGYFSPYDGTGYWKLKLELERYVWTVTITNDTVTESFDFETDVEITQLEYLMVQSYRGGGYPDISGYLWWVDAPFEEIRGLREWDETNTHEYVWENPYNMTVNGDGESANATVLCMPLQGFKTLWNWDYDAITAYGRIDIRFRSRDGSEYGFIRWESQWGGGNHYFRFIDSSGTYFTLTNHFTQTDAVSISFWIEKSGSAFMYAQDDPESHTFCDFWVVEVTDEIDFDSWGGRIDIYVSKVGAGVTENRVALKEAEIFYGLKEGISQPRFGGMWWQYNPILVFFMMFINFITAPFVWLANLLTSFFSPIIAGIVTVITQVVTDFINNFIAPMVAGIFDWLITNFVSAIMGGAMLIISVLNYLLSALSGLLFAGNTTILPNAFWAFIDMLFGTLTFIAVGLVNVAQIFNILTGVMLGQPVTGIWLAPMNFIVVIFYYVATYAPIAFMMYMLMKIVECVREGSIEPLIDLSLKMLTIGMFIFNIIKAAITFLYQAIVQVLELIPF